MPVFLKQRQPWLREIMDGEDCNPRLLQNTYQQFAGINGLLCQWHRIYQRELKPLMKTSRSYTLLDIGFGGGDVPVRLYDWARGDGVELRITAIETDRRAYRYALCTRAPASIKFRYCSTSDLIREGKRFDFVISNHVLHHLSVDETGGLLEEARTLALGKVIFNDIERSDLGYLLFSLFARPLFRQSYIVVDGLTSIKRSYTLHELKHDAPDGWQVRRLFPFRLLLTTDGQARS